MYTALDILQHIPGPHTGQPVLFSRAAEPSAALIAVHGRGGDAESMHHWATSVAPNACILTPQAAQNSWYPQRFLVPQYENQPSLDSALAMLDAVVSYCECEGFSKESLVLAGFSQGACMIAEYAKRNPARYRGIALMSGGLIGSDEEVATVSQIGRVEALASAPVYIGCDEHDPHIPISRVHATAEFFSNQGATVDLHIYQGLGHTIHPDAAAFIHIVASTNN
jgi:phospholipase/carboxylesterase